MPHQRAFAVTKFVLWPTLFVLCFAFIYVWGQNFGDNNLVVIYFGRPRDIGEYLVRNASSLARSSFWCSFVAISSLFLSGVIDIALLCIGLFYAGSLESIERTSAALQTVPVIVIVAVSLLVETQLASTLGLTFPVSLYCLPPVTISLMFPPLANGVGAVRRMPLEVKELLRVWNASSVWRIRRIYLPIALPEILTGLRASSTWAIGSTLIAEGLLNGVNGDSDTLGHYLLRPFSSNASAGRTPAVAFAAVVLGFSVYALFSLFQRICEHLLLGRTEADEATYSL